MKTKANTKIDWDVIDADVCCFPVGIPEGAITAKMIMDRYGLSHSTASRKLRDLGEKDGYRLLRVKSPESAKIVCVVVKD